MSDMPVENKGKEIARLGDGDVFIRRTENGAIKAVRGAVRLEEKKGHIAVIEGKAMITAGGFNEMNRIAGVSIITPEKLTLPDGSMVVNPYPIIDRESGTITKVWVKKLGIGYSPIGNIVITSSTLLYDISMYFIQDLVKKVQYNKNAGKICTEQSLTDEEKAEGMFFRIEGPFGVWANFQDKDILKALNTFIQNKLFAERKAQTICERNVLKKHPALAAVYVDAKGPEKNGVALVPVIGFTHDLTKEDLFKLARMAENGEDVSEFKGRAVEFIEATDEISEEDIVASTDEEEIIHDDPKGTPLQTEKSDEGDKEIEILREYVLQSRNILGDELDQIIEANFKKPISQLNIKQLKMAKKLVDEFVDKAGEF